MQVLIISIGTRGDMEPFLAIGRILQERGHAVTC
ncbi:MAG TPA: glycosyltransferase [Flavobacteriales bacterium]|nr:glycosyltransferase [Flavobacteriales bacterium]